MAAVTETISLPGTGQKMPVVAYGTFTCFQDKPGEVSRCVEVAIEAGYRHVDTAWVYKNEHEVGQGVRTKIQQGVVRREDLFITTKAWDTHHSRQDVRQNLEKSLKLLQMDYVDLYLVHWPTSMKEGEDDFPKDADGNISFSFHDILDTWKGMEDCVKAGLARNIGISNFNSEQIQRVLDNCSIKPCNLQVEVNPTFTNDKLIQFASSNDIVVSSYAPLGAPGRPWKQSGDPCAMEDPVITAIAGKKGKTPAQVILRWHLQRGLCLCVKSLTPERVRQNLEVFDFELSPEEMRDISALNKDFRLYSQPICKDHPEYPFNIEF